MYMALYFFVLDCLLDPKAEKTNKHALIKTLILLSQSCEAVLLGIVDSLRFGRF